MSQQDPFDTTRWTIVLAAKDWTSPEARQALEALCKVYWPPLYAFIRRRGKSPEEAEDLTQGFFTRLLEPDFLKNVDRSRGKFRAFLLASCKYYLANERERASAIKRGGSKLVISIDRAMAEGQYQLELSDESPPDATFDRHWARTLLDTTLQQIQSEFESAGQGERYQELKPTLVRDSNTPYAQVAERLGISEDAVKVAAHRLRGKFREALRARIAATVGSAEEVDDEIRDLFSAFAAG
jgi:RNA polymerase sigma factor (sigma-70 family)